MARIGALFACYGRTMNEPGAARDVALAMAQRHEPVLMSAKAASLSAVFLKYGLDPDANMDFQLVLALAGAYVPGFTRAYPVAPRRHRVRTRDVAILVLCIAEVADYLDGPETGDLTITKAMTDPKTITKVVGPHMAGALQNVLARIGNRERGEHPRQLSKSALRGYVRQIRQARKALSEGTLTGFQEQVLFRAVPAIRRWAEGASAPRIDR
ncbi:MAG: hypothetical protein ACKVP3_09250 [Hyphomicrobiaceae bacterium]